MACCGHCTVHIGNHSRHLHADCAEVFRGRIERTTREYRAFVPSRTIKRERELLRKYDAEQKAKEVTAEDPSGTMDESNNSHRKPPAAGSAPGAGLVPKGEMTMQCPACGGQVIEVGWNGYASSLCCDMPLVVIKNWELFETLPAELRQIAIDQDRLEYAKLATLERKNARLFGEWKQEADARWPHLFQIENRVTPY